MSDNGLQHMAFRLDGRNVAIDCTERSLRIGGAPRQVGIHLPIQRLDGGAFTLVR